MKPRSSGFTLMELLVTIAVVGVLLAIAVPSFQSLFNRNRVATVVNDLLGGLYYARTEGIRRALPTTICMSSNQTSCATTGSWANGWIVWVDLNSNGTLDTGELVRTHGPINAGNTALSASQTSYTFTAQGALVSGGSAGTFKVCTPNDLTLSRQIAVQTSGQIGSQPLSSATCP